MATLGHQVTGIDVGTTSESAISAVSWPAVFGGAFAATGVSVILAGIGAGLGLASVSVWHHRGVSATTFTAMTAAWLVLTQWVASGCGGYLAGRLRTKWAGLHTHEVFFRDTAHGFITWAVATVLVGGLLALDTSALVGATAGAAGASASANGSSAAPAVPYDVDVMFRSTSASAETGPAASEARSEAARILARDLPTGDVPAADRTYLASLVTARTGISRDEAQKRVDTAITDMRATEDKARKAAAMAATYTALSMLIGAFIACVAAALGGHRRDIHA